MMESSIDRTLNGASVVIVDAIMWVALIAPPHTANHSEKRVMGTNDADYRDSRLEIFRRKAKDYEYRPSRKRRFIMKEDLYWRVPEWQRFGQNSIQIALRDASSAAVITPERMNPKYQHNYIVMPMRI